jgi:succinyl-CoA synthetase beta subunit
MEVNPLGETPEDKFFCFNTEKNFDDTAEFWPKDIFVMDDKSESEPNENEATNYDLKCTGVDRKITCFVSGLGFLMAVCVIIFLSGGKLVTLILALGDGVKEAQKYQAFKLLGSGPESEAILVNTFGDIVNGAIITMGITKACCELETKAPGGLT